MKNERNDAMRKNQHKPSRMVSIAGYLLLATGLSLLVGCATVHKAKVEWPEPKPATEKAGLEQIKANTVVVAEQPQLTERSVVHLSNGREGFVINETAAIDDQVRAEFDQASAMINEAKHEKAIELLEKVIAKLPGLTAPRINVAIAYNHMKKPEQAEQHLKKVLELIPGHPVASNEYGLLLRKAGRFAESREIYEESLATFPEYAPLHRNLGILCDLYLKDSTCAVEHYDIYAKVMPKDPRVKLWLVDLHSRGHKVASLKAPVGMDN